MLRAISRLLSRNKIILNQKEFDAFIQRERNMVERHGSYFSLAVFNVNGIVHKPQDLKKITSMFKERLRCTDIAGWLDQGQIGLMLPLTTRENAHLVAKDILKRTDLDGKYSYEIHLYPVNISNHIDSDNDARGSRKADSTRDSKSKSNQGNRSSAPKFDAQVPTDQKDNLPGAFFSHCPLWKRTMDILISSAAILLLSPILLAVTVAVKMSSHGPILFRQKRCGFGGKVFRMYKFRTMIIDAEDHKHKLLADNHRNGPVFKIENDPRLTRVGNFLRRWSLDELPQLFNVLLGDMSLVGPRPPIVEEVRQYKIWQQRRLAVKPGITCIWQVRSRDSKDFDHWVREDIEYIAERSFLTDLKILIFTIPAVLSGKGAW